MEINQMLFLNANHEFEEEIKKEFHKIITEMQLKYISNFKMPLVLINLVIFLFIFYVKCSNESPHQIISITFWYSFIFLIISFFFNFWTRKTENVSQFNLPSTNIIILNFLWTIPFKIISGLLSTNFNNSGDPVIVILSLEILYRFSVFLFYNHSFRINLISALINLFYLWTTMFLFHSKISFTVICYLFTNTILNIMMLLFSYHYEKKIFENLKITIYLKNERNYFLELIDEIKAGFCELKKGEIISYNKYLSKIVKINKENETRRFDLIINFIQNTFKNLENINSDLPKNLIKELKLESHSNDYIETEFLIKKQNQNSHNWIKNIEEVILRDKHLFEKKFIPLGKFVLKNEEKNKHYQILIRYSNSIEVIFVNTTKTSTLEKTKAEMKYKSMYLSKIAHEFKNPLLSIINTVNPSTEIKKHDKHKNDTLKNTEIKEFIVNLCHYLLFLIEDLDHISKKQLNFNLNERDNSFSEFDISESIDFCCEIFKNKNKNDAIKSKLKIEIEIDDSVHNVKIKEDKLKQILINLLSNSYKFTNSGTIKISLQKNKDNPNSARFSVEDTGIGIPTEDQKKILSNNYSKDNMYSTSGSGFGLRIVQDILKDFESQLQFTSKDNKGSKFWFDLETYESKFQRKNYDENTIKLSRNYFNFDEKMKGCLFSSYQMSSEKCEKHHNSESHKTADFDDGLLTQVRRFSSHSEDNYFEEENGYNRMESFTKGYKILVCDDEEFMRTTTINLLKSFFHKKKINPEIIQAINGIDALYIIYTELLKNNGIDFLLIDESMPFMRGSLCISILQKMKEENHINSLKICSITSFGEDSFMNYIKNSGCDFIIIKPPKMNDFERFFNIYSIREPTLKEET